MQTMTSTGRRLNPVWIHFTKIKVDGAKLEKAKCKDCGMVITALVERMKKHRNNDCTGKLEEDADDISIISLPVTSRSNSPAPSTSSNISSQSNLSNASPSLNISSLSASTAIKRGQWQLGAYPTFIRTTKAQKIALDQQCARFIYATNSSFRITEHPEFIKFVESLRPGYQPPNRKLIGAKLLDDEYKQVYERTKEVLKDKAVCLSIDGWSNIQNDPIICACATEPLTNQVYLIDTIDTTGKPHTSEYLSTLTESCIIKCSREFLCTIGGVVTDNANNMHAMRTSLGLSQYENVRNIFTYGCSAHLGNLVAKDIRDNSIIETVKTVVKYFKNHHEPRAKYKEAGGSKLVLPIDIRWNSARDCFKSFIKNYCILMKICIAHKHVFDDEVVNIILNQNLIASAQTLICKLDKVGEALNKLQSDRCYLSEAYEIWNDLLTFFQEKNSNEIADINADLMTFMERYKVAITVIHVHVVANMLDPRYKGNRVSPSHRDEAMKYLQKENPSFIGELLKFNAESEPYISSLFDLNALKTTNPYIWWKAVGKDSRIPTEFKQFCLKVFSCVASSAGIERLFSTFGIVHSKLRNRLGVEKTAKLVTIFKHLNVPVCRDGPKKKTAIHKEQTQTKEDEEEELDGLLSFDRVGKCDVDAHVSTA